MSPDYKRQPTGQVRPVNLSNALRALLLLLLLAAIVLSTVAGLLAIWDDRPVDPLPAALRGQDLVNHLNNLDKGGIAAVEAHALDQLKRDVLDPQALQRLGIVAGLRKDVQRQEDIALVAARLTMRDPRTQLSAVNLSLQKRQYESAMQHLDGVLRARPELAEQLYPTLELLIGQDDAVEAVAATLASTPPWRKGLVARLVAKPEGRQNAYRLFSALRKAGSPPTSIEIRQFLMSQFDEGSYEEAYFFWLDSLDEARLSRVQNIYDGGFDFEPENHYFDWNIKKSRNATVSMLTRPGSSTNRALKLEFLGHEGAYSGVSQYLRLMPGTYTLRVDVLVQALNATRGLVWRLKCIGDNKVIAETPAIANAGPWTLLETAFTVPPESCGTQVLQLQTAARSGLDTALSGTLYMDDVRIDLVANASTGQESKQ